MNKRQSGFTLVEIAIVLVIIGLLLGGVLKGQEMIANGKYKSLRNDVASYAAAFYSFQDRYKALPGDMAAANAQAQVNAAAPGGNGNGQITVGGTCSAAADESCMLWQHLRYANLIPGDPTLTGTNANPTTSYGTPVQGIYYATLGGRTGNWIVLQNLTMDVAQRLDRDMDDGTANTGTVVCTVGCGGGTYPATGTVTVASML